MPTIPYSMFLLKKILLVKLLQCERKVSREQMANDFNIEFAIRKKEQIVAAETSLPLSSQTIYSWQQNLTRA